MIKPWLRYAAVLIVWISPAPAALAASFDCHRSLSQMEAAICGNPAISRAEEKTNLTEEQAQEKCVRLPRGTSGLECRVQAFAGVKGDADGTLKYQHLTYWDLGDGHQFPEEDIVVLRKGSGKAASLKPIAAAFREAAIFDEVELVKSRIAEWILITGHSGEHGHPSFLYRYERGRVTTIDTDSWHDELSQRVPRGFQLAAEIMPDYRTMTAKAVFTRDGVAYCCATDYATAFIRLGLSGSRLALKDVRFERRRSLKGSN